MTEHGTLSKSLRGTSAGFGSTSLILYQGLEATRGQALPEVMTTNWPFLSLQFWRVISDEHGIDPSGNYVGDSDLQLGASVSTTMRLLVSPLLDRVGVGWGP